jgi:glucan phosphoethanolaminetransferase (alkaline phosphatase superfamily)
VSLIPSFEHTKTFVATRLRPEVAGTSAVVGWGVFLWYGEPEPLLLFAVLAVHLASVLLLTSLFGRPRVAFAITTLFLLGVFVASRAKFALVAMNLHAYDLAFYVSSAPVEFFFSAYPRQAWLMLLALAMTATALYFVWRHDVPRTLSLRHRGQLVMASVVVAFVGHLPLAQRNADFFNERHFALLQTWHHGSSTTPEHHTDSWWQYHLQTL